MTGKRNKRETDKVIVTAYVLREKRKRFKMKMFLEDTNATELINVWIDKYLADKK